MLNIISIKCLLVSVCQEKLLNLKGLKANFHTYFDPRYISKYVPDCITEHPGFENFPVENAPGPP